MQFKLIPELTNNQYSMEILFNGFGNEQLTEEQEKELIQDYAPCIEYKDITFIGNYFYDEKAKKVKKYEEKKQEIPVGNIKEKVDTKDEGVQTEEEKKITELQGKEIQAPEVSKLTAIIIPKEDKENINKVSLIVKNNVIIINDTLKIKYVINSSQILDNELGGSLNTKDKVAKAKCYLFADKVIEAIKEKLEEIRQANSNFEEEQTITL